MSANDTPADQPPETPETKIKPDKTFWGAFGRRATIYVTAVATAVCIAPSIRFDNKDAARFGLAAIAVTLLIFIDLLIYLFAYKEELSGYLFKIFNAIKNFSRRLPKTFLFRIGLTLLFLLTYNIIENSILHSEKIRNLPAGFNFSLKSNELSEIQNIRKSTFFYASGALFVALLLALPFAKRLKFVAQKHILEVFVLTVVFGGALAFFIPAFLYNYEFIGDTKDLTTALFTITGGTIALFSLIKSHQKSELEREQLDTQKQKDARDHTRQVHAARRDRYIEAIDKLSSEHASVRLGGVYALVGLVDEWLDDDIIGKETRLKEGQVIVNNLCSYIRSPFILAEKREIIEAVTSPYVYSGNLNKDKARLHEEQEVRRTIFAEMSKRGSTFTKNEEGDIIPILGTWSEFKFDFSRAPIFYPLREVKFTNANFNNAKFYGHTDFSHSQFYGEANIQHADFYGPTLFDYTYFHNGLNLSFSHFHMDAGITSSTVSEKGIFFETHFHKEAFFSDTDFSPEGRANFSITKFHQRTVFNHTNFHGEAIFSADFMSSTSFEGAYFEVEPNFEYSYFSDKEEHNFETRESSPYHIKTKVKNYKGKRIKLPIGADIYTSNVEKNLPSNNSENSSEL